MTVTNLIHSGSKSSKNTLSAIIKSIDPALKNSGSAKLLATLSGIAQPLIGVVTADSEFIITGEI